MAFAEFKKEHIGHLLHNKFVVIIGDSIQRGIYKDLVLLLQRNELLTNNQLRAKGEYNFSGDDLIEGGKKSKEGLNNGIKYQEVRQYHTDTHLVRFYFTTRCYNAYVESIINDLKNDPKPDLIIMNSCLWDLTRYGKNAIEEYKVRLDCLFSRFKEELPVECLIVWNTTMPISRHARGGFLVPEVKYCNRTLRLDVLEANFYARNVVVSHGFDVLDLHFFLRDRLDWRVADGIHWRPEAHRRITNILLAHVSNAWDYPLPEATLPSKNSKKHRGHSHQLPSRHHQRSYSSVLPMGSALPPYIKHSSLLSPDPYVWRDVGTNLDEQRPHADRSEANTDLGQPQPLKAFNSSNSWLTAFGGETSFVWEPYPGDDLTGSERHAKMSYQHYRYPW